MSSIREARAGTIGRLLILPVVLLACMGGGPMPDSPGAGSPSPVWTAGQTWKVEYLRTVPSAVMGPVKQPPPPERTVWKYEVLKAATEHDPLSTLLITQDGGKRRFEMTLSAPGPFLVSASEIKGASRDPIDRFAPNAPYFGWGQSQPCIFDWPLFGEKALKGKLPFTTPNGDLVEQEIRALEGGAFEVVLTQKDEYGRITRSTQTWKRAEPWWVKALVEVTYSEKEPDDKSVEIRGNRLP
jgi:hypothetical protein